MRALIYRGPRELAVTEVPDARPPDGLGAVVAVSAAGVCGSDLHIYDGHGFTHDVGYCVGHEAVARSSRSGTMSGGSRWGPRPGPRLGRLHVLRSLRGRRRHRL